MVNSTVPTPDIQESPPPMMKAALHPRVLDNKFYLDSSPPRAVPKNMNLFYPISYSGEKTLQKSAKEQRIMPSTGPFSVAAAKISNILENVDDVNHDQVMEKLYLDCLELNKEAMKKLS